VGSSVKKREKEKGKKRKKGKKKKKKKKVPQTLLPVGRSLVSVGGQNAARTGRDRPPT